MYAYIGSFTAASRGAAGAGISVYQMDSIVGEWRLIQQAKNLVNPSFLAVNREQTILYSVHADETYATTFLIDRKTGRLTFLKQTETGGRNGVKIILDPAERFAIVANYGTGNISVLPIAADGALLPCSSVLRLEGKPHLRARARHQEMSHPHDLAFDPSGRFIIVPDKGLDRVFVVEFSASDGSLKCVDQGRSTARGGSGPRHAVFHPSEPWVWVANELDSTVTTYRWDGERGTLVQVDVVSTLPVEFNEDSIVAEIGYHQPSNALYVSNRGHDSIAMFRADLVSGGLQQRGWIPSGGTKPRFFSLDPTNRYLCVANEKDGRLAIFEVASDSGRLMPSGGAVHVASPASIVFVT